MAPPEWEATKTVPAHVRLSEVSVALAQAGLPDRKSLPVIATVRNPWDWYVSLYFFMEQHYVNRTGAFVGNEGSWTAGGRVWSQRFSKGNHVEGFREALPEIIEAIHHEGNHAVAPPQGDFVLSNGTLGVRAVRFEDLRNETIAAIEETGAEIPDAMRAQILQKEPSNTSGHAHYADCYDGHSRSIVKRAERPIIREMRYRFERRS